MSTTVQKVFAWCGLGFVVVFFAGMILAGLFPPQSPKDSAEEIAQDWADNAQTHRLGLYLCMMAAGLQGPFAAVISVYLKKIEPNGSYSNMQLIGGATAVVAILVPIFIWCAASYRANERPTELTLALSDMAWIPFVMNTPPALLQCFAIGCAAFDDKREKPIFPRWVGYYNIWTATLFLPGGLVVFFKDGPFAWDGVLAYWVVAILFGTWFIVMNIVLLKAIKESETAPVQASP